VAASEASAPVAAHPFKVVPEGISLRASAEPAKPVNAGRDSAFKTPKQHR